MLVIMLRFVLLFLGAFNVQVDSQQSNALRCLGGIVIYSVDKTKFLLDLGSGLITCESGESCGLYSWINTDQSDITTFAQNGFCASGNEDCSTLASLPGVGNVENCETTICSTDECNEFLSPVCNLGSVAYTLDRTIALVPIDVRKEPCQIGESCGMFRWINTDENNFKSYVEAGYCEAPSSNSNCSELPGFPFVETVENCTNEECSGNECENFSIEFPEDRGFKCSRGTMVYSLDRSRVITTKDLNDDPCAQWQACAMYRWINTDDNGARTYAESGFCLNIIQISSFSCTNLPDLPDVGRVEDCSFRVCSGDFCEEFTGGASIQAFPSMFTSIFFAVLLFVFMQ